MGKFLFSVMAFVLNSGFKRVLLGAGVGILSATALNSLLQTVINNVVNSFNNIATDVLALLGLSGIDTALSLIISALITKATINSLSLTFVKQP